MRLRLRHPDVVTLPQLFREQGYFTASLGKVIHAGLDANGKRVFFRDAKSWDDCRSFNVTPTGQRGEGRNFSGGKFKWASWLAAAGTDEDQPDGQNAAEAIKLLKVHRDGPFFLAVGFHKPHDPFNAPKKYFAPYPLDKIQLAQDPADRSAELPMAVPKGENKTLFDSFTDQDRREFRRACFAGISFTDAQIGKLLDTLDRLKLWDNTIVAVMGDHGYHLGEHGWWLKFTIFELCAFTPVARGAVMGRSVRTDRWRYTERDEGRAGIELYDHTSDALEYHSLAAQPEHTALIAEMRAILHRGKP